MKRLLRQKANFSVLEGFFSVFLNEKIKIVNIKESESNKTNPEDKFNRVDIFVENDLGELMIIEMQNNEQVDYFLRMLYGVSKAITDHISEGEPYSKVRKVYHINIVYFKLGHGKDYVYRGTTEFRGIHCNDVLQLTAEEKEFFARQNRKNVNEVKDLFAEYFLLCVEDFDNVAKDSLDEWIYYFKNNAIPDEFEAPGLNEARKRLQYDSLSEQEQIDYRYHLKQRLYEQSSIETAIFKGQFRGEAKGKAERERLKIQLKDKDVLLKNKDVQLKDKDVLLKKTLSEKEMSQKKVILNCHQAGLPLDMISKITGLTHEYILKILEIGN
jgi:predicted transposase/invertase (TIGR01784 family)